jgi:hypothetical protein
MGEKDAKITKHQDRALSLISANGKSHGETEEFVRDSNTFTVKKELKAGIEFKGDFMTESNHK